MGIKDEQYKYTCMCMVKLSIGNSCTLYSTVHANMNKLLTQMCVCNLQ